MKIPALDLENEFRAQGYRLIAGLDESGRGAWAGPVMAAAVILPLGQPDLREALKGVRDSKTIYPPLRARLRETIAQVALAVGVGKATSREIEKMGIVGASRLAMRRALDDLALRPDALLIDYLSLPDVRLPQHNPAHGEDRSLSIAAASIVAKVTRDGHMIELDDIYPGYGFARHKGYGTAVHRQALGELGPCDIHRRTFRPVWARLPLRFDE
jgi:ribonuclease HII